MATKFGQKISKKTHQFHRPTKFLLNLTTRGRVMTSRRLFIDGSHGVVNSLPASGLVMAHV